MSVSTRIRTSDLVDQTHCKHEYHTQVETGGQVSATTTVLTGAKRNVRVTSFAGMSDASVRLSVAVHHVSRQIINSMLSIQRQAGLTQKYLRQILDQFLISLLTREC